MTKNTPAGPATQGKIIRQIFVKMDGKGVKSVQFEQYDMETNRMKNEENIEIIKKVIKKEIGETIRERRCAGGVIKLYGKKGMVLLRSLFGLDGCYLDNTAEDIEKIGEYLQCDLEFC